MVLGFSTVELFALILALIVAVKLIVVLINPVAWFNFAKKIWKAPTLMMVVSLVFSSVVLYYLLQSGFTIVDIFAVMLFFALLAAVGVAVYSKELMEFAGKLTKDKKPVKKSWLYILL